MVDEKDEKKKGRERRLECVKDWQEKLKNQYKDLTTKRVQAIKYRDADPSILDVLEGRSKITTTDLKSGKAKAEAWTCDFSKEYVTINSEYST